MAEPKPFPDRRDLPLDDSSAEDSASEFLSEKSSDFESLRRRVADRSAAEPRRTATILPVGRASTDKPSTPSPSPASLPVRWHWLALIALVVVAVPGYIFYQNRPAAPAAEASPSALPDGTATIESRPPGATVFVDGVARGVTPLELPMPPGVYAVELRNGGATRTLSLKVEPGAALRESVDLVPPSSVGRLVVTSDVPGARVLVDGVSAGSTPLTLNQAPVGARRVTVVANGTNVSRTVVVEPGATASVFLQPQPPAPAEPGVAGGWVSIQSPFELQVVENGEIVGTSAAARILLPIGLHVLELRSTRFQFRTAVTVEVGAGRTVSIPVSVPNGRLSLNAVPWAEVWLDGQPLGQTPVANVEVRAGSHEVLLRHPQFGERRESVDVAADASSRFGIDMSTGRVLGR